MAQTRQLSEPGQSQPELWEGPALADLIAHADDGFRRFMRRYAVDILDAKKAFRSLSYVFGTLHNNAESSGATQLAVLRAVFDQFPDTQDADLLKTDAVVGNVLDDGPPRSPDTLAVLNMSASDTGLRRFLLKKGDTMRGLCALWSSRSDEILALVDEISQLPNVDDLLREIALTANAATFIKVARDYPSAQRSLVRLNPLLLDSPDLTEVTATELMPLIEIVNDGEDVCKSIIRRLFLTRQLDVIRLLMSRFPETFYKVAVEMLASDSAESDDEMLPPVWKELFSNGQLASVLLARASSTSQLATIASLLHLDVKKGLLSPIETWIAALNRSVDDAHGESRQRLLAYLLAIALASPGKGCEPLFELAFEPTHTDLALSRLPANAYPALLTQLPAVPWWQYWDVCFRLRLGVVSTYVAAELDTTSFQRLTDDKLLFESLLKIAESTGRGRRFVRDLRG